MRVLSENTDLVLAWRWISRTRSEASYEESNVTPRQCETYKIPPQAASTFRSLHTARENGQVFFWNDEYGPLTRLGVWRDLITLLLITPIRSDSKWTRYILVLAALILLCFGFKVEGKSFIGTITLCQYWNAARTLFYCRLIELAANVLSIWTGIA